MNMIIISNYYLIKLQKLIKDSEEPVKSYKKICIPFFACNMKNIKKKLEMNMINKN